MIAKIRFRQKIPHSQIMSSSKSYKTSETAQMPILTFRQKTPHSQIMSSSISYKMAKTAPMPKIPTCRKTAPMPKTDNRRRLLRRLARLSGRCLDGRKNFLKNAMSIIQEIRAISSHPSTTSEKTPHSQVRLMLLATQSLQLSSSPKTYKLSKTAPMPKTVTCQKIPHSQMRLMVLRFGNV